MKALTELLSSRVLLLLVLPPHIGLDASGSWQTYIQANDQSDALASLSQNAMSWEGGGSQLGQRGSGWQIGR